MTLDHWEDDLLPKFGELTFRHQQYRLHLVDCFILPLLRQDRQVPAHLSESHRSVHRVYRPVGLINQRPGISYDCVSNGSHWLTPFATRATCLFAQSSFR
jgi:hypothetical protein